MGVICFGSLKGGVGKTSLSVNVAHAFAERGCEVLLIDLDPMGHASRFFRAAKNGAPKKESVSSESPLARLFLGCDLEAQSVEAANIVEVALTNHVPLVQPVRPRLALMPSGPELRHFLWGRGARLFRDFFPKLIRELSCSYDYIIIDTPPDFNILVRNAIAASDIVVVPVDSSAMSIHCLEEIVSSAAHIKGPCWAIVRSMVTRQASRMQRLTSDRLRENLQVKDTRSEDPADDADDLTDPAHFISLLERRELENRAQGRGGNKSEGSKPEGDGPIYLLNSLIYRSEAQNKLSFSGRTAFDSSGDSMLREHYSAVAAEIEQILSLGADSDPLLDINENFALSLGMQ